MLRLAVIFIWPELQFRRKPSATASVVHAMEPAMSHDFLDVFITRLVHHKASQLLRLPGFTESDRADLQQNLLVKLIAARPYYRSKKGTWHAYAATVLDRHAATLARDHQAQKRRSDREVPYRTDHSTDLRREFRLEDSLDLALDLKALWQTCSLLDRQFLELLMSESVTVAAKKLAISRRTCRDRLKKMRRRFEAAGLEDYLA
jgi:RNA polymerase sigma-70 factor (ECF subfamily)